MSPTQPGLDVDDLIARIKAEAARLEGAVAPLAQASPVAPLSLPKLADASRARGRNQLADLLCVQEPDEFLDSAYRALLGREPDETGRRVYGGYLRRGGSRLFVLHALIDSGEGRARGASLAGLPWGRVFRAMPWKGLLSPVLRRVEHSYLRRNPELVAKAEVDRLRAQLDQWAGGITQRTNVLATLVGEVKHLAERTVSVESAAAELRGGAEWLQHQIDDLSAQGSVLTATGDRTAQTLEGEIARRQRLVKDIDFIRSDLIYHRSQVRDLVDKLVQLNADLPSSSVGAGDAAPQAGEVGNDLRAHAERQVDAFYVAFEEEFRGAQEEIRATQEGYLADIRAAGAGGDADPVLDLGCGRGEWLALLKEQGLCGRGVDTNGVMVRQCRERGLDAEQGDALRLLAGLPDGALGAVTAFHIIEHLPFLVLHDLIEQAHRALRPGGTLILETPNPENLLVGSHTFYHDPTHRNPMTPTATRFLVRYFGFEDPEVRRLHPYPEAAKVPGHDPLTERVNGHLCGPQDFAIVARKPASPV